MEPRSPFNDDNLPTDKLTSDRLPPDLEDDQAEYFADMAFDERLTNILELIPTATTIDITHTTTGFDDILTKHYFPTNTFRENTHHLALSDDELETITELDEAYSFRMYGVVEEESGTLSINARIDPEIGNASSVKIKTDPTTPDCFYVQKVDDEFDFTIINTKELFSILCQIAGADKRDVDQLMVRLNQSGFDSPQLLQTNIYELWTQIGETHGKRSTVREIAYPVEHPQDPHFPETINLRYEETEDPDITLIKLFLEHSVDMPDLDAKESHLLSLIFEQANHKSTHKQAEKVIESGVTTPRLISSRFEKKSKGRVTQLDINDSTVKALFINWFDQLISS